MATKPPDSPLSHAATNATGTSPRLLALDAFRGLTIVAMILVNNPGSWGHIYWPLGHAPWHGWTPTDLVFPFFLFIVGTSLAYSLRKYRDGQRIDRAVYGRIVRRTLLLVFLGWLPGLLLRSISYFSGTSATFDVETLRLPGVLVRIALVYCAASLIVLNVRERGQAVLAAVLLLGYWALLAWLPNPHDYQSNLSPAGNIIRIIDRALVGDSHLYTQAQREPTDPEGLTSTLPAIVTALLGYWTGLMIQRRGINVRTVNLMIAAGAVCTAVGWAWGLALPINKKIWTSSYVLLTGGLAMIALAGCLLVFDVWGRRRLARPLEIVGINAIFVFVASGLVAILLGRTHVGDVTTHQWLYDTLFTSWISEPKSASLGYALATVACWWLVLWAMARRGWSIRV
jgi:predicted acyltransferase